jgi:Arc/MetJ-type ribon-helix-helix transcriptional regulator
LHYLAETFISRREEWVFVPVVSIKLTEAQARALAKRVKERGYPSKSEFLRYAIMRALEDNLSVAALEDVFESRRQIRKGKTVSLDELMLED